MKAITAFLEDFDFSKILPKIGSFLKDIRFWLNFIMLLGPLVILVFGLWYFFLPLKEANHKLGFRTYFGMGSVEAWKFTQRLAGWVWMILGGATTLISLILMLVYKKKDMMALATGSVVWLGIVAILAVASYIAISIIATLRYDHRGDRRETNKKVSSE